MIISTLRPLAAGAVALGLAVASAALGSVARAEAPATIRIDNFSFVPDAITIKVGSTVTWENEDDIPHSIVMADKSFHSKPLDTHDRVSFTFTKTGTMIYFCGLHPHMKAEITVVP